MTGRDPTDEIGSDSKAQWTRANVGELIPGVATPLTATTTGLRCETAGRAVWHALGVLGSEQVPVPVDVDQRQNAFARGRLCLNLTVVREIVAKIPGADADSFERDVAGHVQPETTPVSRGRTSWSDRLRVGGRGALAVTTVGRQVRRRRRETDAWWRASTSGQPPVDLQDGIALMRDADQRFHAILCSGILASMCAQGTYGALAKTTERSGVGGLETSLVSGYDDLDEARVAGDLAAVSTGGISHSTFLARHGYHSGAQYHVSGSSWRESSEQLDAAISRISDRPADLTDPARRGATREAAVRELLDAQPRWRRPATRALLRLVHNFVVLREAQKVSGLQAVDVLRHAARGVGSALVDADVLDDPDDVHFLTSEEILTGRYEDARGIVTSRKAQHSAHEEVEIPSMWVGGLPPAGPSAASTAHDTPEAPSTIAGVPASPGVVEGTATVVFDAEAGLMAEPGSVLICRTTDPSFVPALMLAAAVVVEIGGPMSHGAIVARDLGIPCVMGAGSVTERIRSGDTVGVDGAAGTVRILARAEGTTGGDGAPASGQPGAGTT